MAVWRGLGWSAFLADITPRDRDPARIAATIVAGACVGLVASVACWILVLAPYTFMIGLGREGLQGLGKVALMFEDSRVHDLGITLLRLVESTATDGVFPLAFVSLAAIMTGRPFQHYVTAAARVRWRLLLLGLALSAVAMAPLVLAGRLTVAHPAPIVGIAPTLAGRAVYVVAAALLIPSAAAEELMFRGWLMRQLAAFTRRPGVLIFATAIAFSAAHSDFTPDAFLTHALMGAGFAYMTLRLGGLELSTGAHAANNILFVLFVEPFSIQGPVPDAAAGLWFGDLGLVAGYIAVTEAIVRVEPLRLWAGVKGSEVAPPIAVVA
ncbi:MAG: lysostaphin resistance A-like protein [Caulobacteraceae bacterium]